MSEQATGPVLVVLAAGRARRYGGCKPLAPVGINGEPVIDVLASDALSVGFATIVLVIGPTTGPAIRYHIREQWPAAVDVRFALQAAPLGTVHAVLSSCEHLDEGAPFGVANADDLYSRDGLALLHQHLVGGSDRNALVAYRLRNAVIGDAPVTRGICEVDGEGFLRSIDERRKLSPLPNGCFAAGDGRKPAEVDGDVLVSVNLWAFGPEMRKLLEAAMAEAQHVSEEAEVLLPEVVSAALGRHRPGGIEPSPFRVLESTGRCIGVTHPGDLPLVQAEIAREVGIGQRAARLWAAVH